jgi:cytochrome P450
MKSLEPEFEALVDARIDSFIELGRVDGLNDLAIPTAIGFSTQQLKVVDLEMATIRRWGAAYLSQFSLMQGREQMLGIARELCDLQRYLIQLVRRRVEHRHDDMLSDLIDARIEDERPGLDFEELVATARAILINTHDSVSTAMSNILLKVATDPVIAERFYASAADERLMSRFVEELLRLEPPVRALSRITTKPITLGGVQLPEGAHLLVLFASGNDDEAVFRCPREFDMNRPNLVRSLTFGSGVHLCLGISLARMQLRVTATRVAKRMRSLCLAVPLEEIRYLPNVALLTVEQLPLEFVRHA